MISINARILNVQPITGGYRFETNIPANSDCGRQLYGNPCCGAHLNELLSSANAKIGRIKGRICLTVRGLSDGESEDMVREKLKNLYLNPDGKFACGNELSCCYSIDTEASPFAFA